MSWPNKDFQDGFFVYRRGLPLDDNYYLGFIKSSKSYGIDSEHTISREAYEALRKQSRSMRRAVNRAYKRKGLI
jgi:hypothetical protein